MNQANQHLERIVANKEARLTSSTHPHIQAAITAGRYVPVWMDGLGKRDFKEAMALREMITGKETLS